MRKISVKVKGKEIYGHVFEGDEFCKREMVYRYFVDLNGNKRFDNFDQWEIDENNELNFYAHMERNRPLIVKGNGFLFIG